MNRNEEVMARINAWEEKNHKKLKQCTTDEWITAMCEIMNLTRSEAEEYLAELVARRSLDL